MPYLQIQWLQPATWIQLWTYTRETRPTTVPTYHSYNCQHIFGTTGLFIRIHVIGVVTDHIIMAKKIFLNRERAIPNADFPSVSRCSLSQLAAYYSRNSLVSGITEQIHISFLARVKNFPKFNANGRSKLMKFRHPWRSSRTGVLFKKMHYCHN